MNIVEPNTTAPKEDTQTLCNLVFQQIPEHCRKLLAVGKWSEWEGDFCCKEVLF